MPRRKAFDKKTATTFSLVYRAQNDPRIHDTEASDMVFTEKINPNTEKIKRRQDLDDEFEEAIRRNEGEAAEYGVYYDDSDYDYMQHLKPIGTSNEAYFIEAPASGKGKGKETEPLEDALKNFDIRSRADTRSMTSSRVSSIAEELLPQDMLPSEFVSNHSYQNQQNVPDEIAGLQPDMDPRLREVLEALNDEAYVDDDEDLFGELQEGGEEMDRDDWEEGFWDDDGNLINDGDDGWESDRTVKVGKDSDGPTDPSDEKLDTQDQPNDNWLQEYNKFKQSSKSGSRVISGRPTRPLDLQSSVQTGASSLTGLRRKKRKGALTASTGYSMTSSILARTEGQSVLDQKFEKLSAQYADDDMDDSISMMSGMTGMSKLSSVSKAASVNRADFDSIMNDFLDTHSSVGPRTRRVKRLEPQSGLDQLREIREGLGPALVKPS
jgi:protein LTV1